MDPIATVIPTRIRNWFLERIYILSEVIITELAPEQLKLGDVHSRHKRV
jgi:hypothetical protein